MLDTLAYLLEVIDPLGIQGQHVEAYLDLPSAQRQALKYAKSGASKVTTIAIYKDYRTCVLNVLVRLENGRYKQSISVPLPSEKEGE